MAAQSESEAAPSDAPAQPAAVYLTELYDEKYRNKLASNVEYWQDNYESSVTKNIFEHECCSSKKRGDWDLTLSETKETLKDINTNDLKLDELLSLTNLWFDHKKEKFKLDFAAQKRALKKKKKELEELNAKVKEVQDEVAEIEEAAAKAQEMRMGQYKHMAEKYKTYLEQIQLQDLPPKDEGSEVDDVPSTPGPPEDDAKSLR